MATRRGGVWYTDRVYPGVGRVNKSLDALYEVVASRREQMLLRLCERGQHRAVMAWKAGRFSIQELEHAYEEGSAAVQRLIEWAGDPKVEDLVPGFLAGGPLRRLPQGAPGVGPQGAPAEHPGPKRLHQPLEALPPGGGLQPGHGEPGPGRRPPAPQVARRPAPRP